VVNENCTAPLLVSD